MKISEIFKHILNLRHWAFFIIIGCLFGFIWILSNPSFDKNLFNKSKNCSTRNFTALPIDFRECFGFFDFKEECEMICVEKCPINEENIELLNVIDKYNHTLSIEYLIKNNMCDSSFNIDDSYNLTYLIEKKICSTYVGGSSSSDTPFVGFCYPDFENMNKSDSYEVIKSNNYTHNGTDKGFFQKNSYYQFYAFSILYKYFGDITSKHFFKYVFSLKTFLNILYFTIGFFIVKAITSFFLIFTNPPYSLWREFNNIEESNLKKFCSHFKDAFTRIDIRLFGKTKYINYKSRRTFFLPLLIFLIFLYFGVAFFCLNEYGYFSSMSFKEELENYKLISSYGSGQNRKFWIIVVSFIGLILAILSFYLACGKPRFEWWVGFDEKYQVKNVHICGCIPIYIIVWFVYIYSRIFLLKIQFLYTYIIWLKDLEAIAKYSYLIFGQLSIQIIIQLIETCYLFFVTNRVTQEARVQYDRINFLFSLKQCFEMVLFENFYTIYSIIPFKLGN